MDPDKNRAREKLDSWQKRKTRPAT
jgi:hypothetical protein